MMFSNAGFQLKCKKTKHADTIHTCGHEERDAEFATKDTCPQIL